MFVVHQIMPIHLFVNCEIRSGKKLSQMGSGYTEKCRYDHDAVIANIRYQISIANLKRSYVSPGDTKTTVDCPNLHAIMVYGYALRISGNNSIRNKNKDFSMIENL